jgi:surfactin synthase thioesterase subunit
MTNSISLLAKFPEPVEKHVLICFPYAGGGAAIFHKWQSLTDICHVSPVLLPGRERKLRIQPYRDIYQLIDDLIPIFDSPFKKGFTLFGHSMGALIIYELTEKLSKTNRQLPTRIILSGRCPPHHQSEIRLVHKLPDEEFLEELISLGGTQRQLIEDPEMRSLLLPLLRADFELVASHRKQPRPMLAIPIHVFGGRYDRSTPEHILREWAHYTSSDFHFSMFEGNHFFIRNKQSEVLTTIRQILSLGRDT